MITIVATAAVLGLLAYLLPSLIATRPIPVQRPTAPTGSEQGLEPAPAGEAPEPNPLPVGYQFGEFQTEEELAPALLGRVYKATDRRRGCTVAINVLAPALRDQIGRFRFLMSARAAAVSADGVIAANEIGGIPLAVVEYVDGVGPMVDIGRIPWGRRTRG